MGFDSIAIYTETRLGGFTGYEASDDVSITSLNPWEMLMEYYTSDEAWEEHQWLRDLMLPYLEEHNYPYYIAELDIEYLKDTLKLIFEDAGFTPGRTVDVPNFDPETIANFVFSESTFADNMEDPAFAAFFVIAVLLFAGALWCSICCLQGLHRKCSNFRQNKVSSN